MLLPHAFPAPLPVRRAEASLTLRRTLSLALGALAALALTGIPAPAPAPAQSLVRRKISLGSETLLYTSLTTGVNLLRQVQGDGTDDHYVPDPPNAGSVMAAWSPDGRKIVFHQFGAEDGLSVMDADGTYLRHLPASLPGDSGATWSPDGTRIAFNRPLGTNHVNIFVMDAEGRSARNITNSPDFDADPAWSPNGKEILFTSTAGGQGFRLYAISPTGTRLRKLPAKRTARGTVFPAWSVDGRQIAFTDQVGDAVELFACDRKGLHRRQLTSLGGLNLFPAWAPDGQHIAFQHYDDEQSHGALMLMDTDGNNPHALIPDIGGAYTGRSTWRPRRRR